MLKGIPESSVWCLVWGWHRGIGGAEGWPCLIQSGQDTAWASGSRSTQGGNVLRRGAFQVCLGREVQGAPRTGPESTAPRASRQHCPHRVPALTPRDGHSCPQTLHPHHAVSPPPSAVSRTEAVQGKEASLHTQVRAYK